MTIAGQLLALWKKEKKNQTKSKMPEPIPPFATASGPT
jgi:hypothetical protein